MAKTETQRPRGGGAVSAEPKPADAAPESLDKVRDILFGGQMRAVETRLQGAEARLQRGQDVLRADLDKRFTQLNAVLVQEVQSLAERLNAERAKRTEELKGLGTEFKESLKALEKRHLKLEEATGMADADLRDELLNLGKAITTEMSRMSERLSAEQVRAAQELKAEKVDTSRLVGLLNDLTAGLAGEKGNGARKGGSKG
jgi:hypothetical protein